MKPEVFFKTRLGWMSSHPEHERRRRFWFGVLAFVPLAAVVLVGIWVALDVGRWLELLRSARAWLVGGGCAISFALGALIALTLTARWAELQGGHKVGAVGTRRELYLERWVAVAAVVLGVVGPVLALVLPSSGRWTGTRVGLHLFALLPLVGVLVGMWCLGGHVDRRRETRKRRPIWLLLAILVLALLLLTLVHDAAVAMSTSGLGRLMGRALPAWYRDLGQPFVGALVLAPLAFVFFAIWRLFPATVPHQPPRPPSAASPEKKGFWAGLWGWVKGLFVPPGDRGRPDKDRWPPWLDELLEDLPEGCCLAEGPQRLETTEGAAMSEAAELKPLFGRVVPTTDQWKLFQRFCESYQEVIDGEGGTEESLGREPSADLLVEGDPGSGRTTALIACAIYAALGRGQRVLFLVANQQRQEIIRKRIDDTLAALHVKSYIHTEIITRTAVERWTSFREDQHPAVPQILIGTLDAVEVHLYGAPHVDKKHVARLRRLVMLLEVVFVDDYMDFDDAQRSHLPFMLDKQRLLAEADFTPLQVVVTCPRLATIARTSFGTRLYTERLLQLDRNVIRLRPRKSGPAWRVDLEADHVSAAVDRMVDWCLRRELDVVLYRRGIDESERRRQEAELRDRAGANQTVAVMSDLDQRLKPSPGDVDAVFYQVAAHQDVCLALRMRFGSADSVIFSVRPTDEVRDMPVSGIVPVAADRSAVPLMVAHLRSAVRFLRRGTPVPETAWSQFGVSLSRLRPARPSESPEVRLVRDLWEGADRQYASRLWPYVTVHQRSRTAASVVDCHALPEETYGLFHHAGLRSVFFVGRIPAREPSEGPGCRSRMRRASWFTSAGQPLGRSTDLAHARELRLVHGPEVFVPKPNIERSEKDNQYRFLTEHWRGNGEDAYLPVYAIEWETADDMTATPLGGGPDYGIQWFHLDAPDGKPLAVDVTIEKLMTEYGVETTIQPLDFSFPARLAGILLLPNEIQSDKLAATIGKSLAGRWGTAGGFYWSTVLTGATNYALHARLPGLAFFASSLTFWLEEEATVGRAITWFIEPTDAGRTVMPILGRLLADSRERDSFFRSVDWFLEQVENVQRPQRFMRRFARIGYLGDENVERIPESRELVGSILGRFGSGSPVQ